MRHVVQDYAVADGEGLHQLEAHAAAAQVLVGIGVVGTLYTMLTNALRIAVICTMIHFLGTDYYYVAHTIVGRIVFYVLQVILYFFIFTKPHVLKMKTGDFGYNKKEEITSKSGGDAQ